MADRAMAKAAGKVPRVRKAARRASAGFRPDHLTFIQGDADDWLQARTGLSRSWWVAAIQAAVARSGRPNPANKDHDLANPAAWLHEMVDAVVAAMPSTGQYDPNMRAGAVMGFALLTWYSRLHLAKVHDPRRPVSIRRDVYRSWLDTMLAVCAIPIDERHDATFFPGQEFETPFHPRARDGRFV